MSRRSTVIARIAGVVAVGAGAYAAWTSSSAASTRLIGPGGSLGVAGDAAFLQRLTWTLERDLPFPWSLVTQPLVWLGAALLIAPVVYRHLARQTRQVDPDLVGTAYVECPDCRHLVPMSTQRCPLCGAEIFSPWLNAKAPAQPAGATTSRR